jgi:hypothetical protein
MPVSTIPGRTSATRTPYLHFDAAAPAGAPAGAAAAAAAYTALLAWCAEDCVGAATRYRSVMQPGVYVMTALPFGDDFGASRPWPMTKPDQFLPPPPPPLSGVRARDLNEIRTVGARTGSTRTPENTHAVQFWVVTGAPIRQSVQNAKLDPLAEARGTSSRRWRWRSPTRA